MVDGFHVLIPRTVERNSHLAIIFWKKNFSWIDVCCCELRKIVADGLRDCVREEAWSLWAKASL